MEKIIKGKELKEVISYEVKGLLRTRKFETLERAEQFVSKMEYELSLSYFIVSIEDPVRLMRTQYVIGIQRDIGIFGVFEYLKGAIGDPFVTMKIQGRNRDNSVSTYLEVIKKYTIYPEHTFDEWSELKVFKTRVYGNDYRSNKSKTREFILIPPDTEITSHFEYGQLNKLK